MNPIDNRNQVLQNELLHNLEYNKRSLAPPIQNTPPSLEREYYIVIDSNYVNGDTNKYKVDLEHPLKDIKSITLTNATIPKPSNGNSANEHHIYLHFEEFSIFKSTGFYENGVFKSCEGADNCFANIALNCDPGSNYYFSEDSPCTIKFKTSKSMLSSLNASWKERDGSLFDFDGDHHNLTLKIVCGVDI